MKALILAAGLGTRLKPLTDNKPKALVELGGKTLLEHAIEKLVESGVSDIIINVHHFHEMMKSFIGNLSYNGISLSISDEKELLLDTGGGLWKAKSFFNDGKPFLLYNVDIISDIDLKGLCSSHIKNKALATLAVTERKAVRTFLWDSNKLCGWRNNNTGEEILSYKTEKEPLQMAFSGIHCINPEIFKLYNAEGVFSIKDVYLKIAKEFKIAPFIHDANNWFDTGTIENLSKAEKYILKR
ncbi:MAG: nucleotidyltransferase family protein [Bacteroidetes bacterium]|nr:nucleotidyltransferase family protein [Bacteroidota bacterium]